MSNKETSTNRVLVVDDDASLIGEYVRCLGEGFEPEDATALASCLERLLTDHALRIEMGRASAARFHAEYTLDRVARAYMDVYASVVKRGATA